MAERDGDDPMEDPFDDEELERALEGFEREFQEKRNGTGPTDGTPQDDQDLPADGDDPERDLRRDLSEFEHGLTFDEELEGLLGDKAKLAMLCTRLQDADLLAAFCTLADISAQCVQASEGAVAILRGLDGNAPESAAQDLTKVVAGLSVLLVVNRADKIESTVYVGGQAGEQLPPPFVFPTLAPFVEDMMLGISTMDELRGSGVTVVDTNTVDHDRALAIIARHTRFDGPNGHVE